MFEIAKTLHLAAAPPADPIVEGLRSITGLGDPLPNGWKPNEAMWNTLVGAVRRQGMIAEAPAADDLLERCEIV
jgi:hypothetical protein